MPDLMLLLVVAGPAICFMALRGILQRAIQEYGPAEPGEESVFDFRRPGRSL